MCGTTEVLSPTLTAPPGSGHLVLHCLQRPSPNFSSRRSLSSDRPSLSEDPPSTPRPLGTASGRLRASTPKTPSFGAQRSRELRKAGSVSRGARARDDVPYAGLDFPSVKCGWCCRLLRGLVCAKALGVVPGLRKCPSARVFTSSLICSHPFNKLDTCGCAPSVCRKRFEAQQWTSWMRISLSVELVL